MAASALGGSAAGALLALALLYQPWGVLVALVGGVFATPQAYVLRRHGARWARGWALATLVAVPVGYLAGMLFAGVAVAAQALITRPSSVPGRSAGAWDGLVLLWLLPALVAGVVVGLAQSLIVSRWTHRFGWWISTSGAAALVLLLTFLWASTLPLFPEDQGPVVAMLEGFLGGALAGAAYGAITGPVLAWLLCERAV